MADIAWSIFESYLRKAFNNRISIQAVLTIGSRNLDKDIDLITFKHPNATSSEYLKDIHEAVDELQAHIYPCRLIKFNRFSDQDYAEYVAEKTDKDILFQMLNYRSLPEMDLIWGADMSKEEDVADLITKETHNPYFIKGDPQKVLSNQTEYSHSGLYHYLERRDRIHSCAPEEFIVKSMNGLFYYLHKRLGQGKLLIANTVQEAREHMYTLAQTIEQEEKTLNL